MNSPYLTKNYYKKRYNETLNGMLKEHPHFNDVLCAGTIDKTIEDYLKAFHNVKSVDKKLHLLIVRRILNTLKETHTIIEYDLILSQGTFKRFRLVQKQIIKEL